MLLQNVDAAPTPTRKSFIPFAEVRQWIFLDALPFWARHGVDKARGGFYEELNFDGAKQRAL